MKKYYIYNIIIFILLLILVYKFIESNSEGFSLKCEETSINSKQRKICLRPRDSDINKEKAKTILQSVLLKIEKLVEYIKREYPDNKITQNIVKKYKFNINESVPDSVHSAYSENKGEKLAFCLYSNKEDKTFIDEHTLTFVAIHELAHVGTESIGHHPEFWRNMKWLLQRANEIGIHKPVDYKVNHKGYCGMTIKDNPFYDM